MNLQPPIAFTESMTIHHRPASEEKQVYTYDMEKVKKLDDPPELHEIDIRNLSSLFLNSNPQFQTLLSALISWNDKVQRYNAEPPNYYQKEHNKLWVNNIILVNLARLLNEVVLTTDRKLQIKMLGTVFDWYYREIGKKPSETPTLGTSFVFDASRPNTSTTMRRKGDSFEIGGLRSEHANYENPKVRLKDYARRLPYSINDNNSASSTTAISFYKMGGEFSRPQTSPFGTGMNYIDMIGGGRPKTTAGGNRTEEQFTVTGNTINIGDFLNKLPGGNSSNQELKREIKSSQEQRPKVRTPAFFNGFFEETPEEKRLEEIWYKQRHKYLAEKKEDEELVGFMKEWASNKGRMEEELSRKGEADKVGSEFNEMKYNTKKTIIMQQQDAEVVLQDFPITENPEHEYVKLEHGMEINKLRVMNEPAEIKGGDEIYIETKKEVLELNYNPPIERELEKYLTPEKERAKKKKQDKKSVFDSIQSNNTATTGLGSSVEKMTTNQSIMQSTETLKLQNVEEKITEQLKLDQKIKKVKEKSSKFNQKRPATEHEQKRGFIRYRAMGNDKLIGDICDSPVIKLMKPGQKLLDLEQEEKQIRIVDFSGKKIDNIKPTRSLQNYEAEICKKKIQNIRYHYSDFLKDLSNNNNNSNQFNNQDPKGSLSVYSRPLTQQHTYRKFSNIFRPELSKESIRKEQIKEIEEVKRRLGHWGLSCSTKKLENGLLMPLVVLGEKVKVAESGCMLFENPFNRGDKKKKPKKNLAK